MGSEILNVGGFRVGEDILPDMGIFWKVKPWVQSNGGRVGKADDGDAGTRGDSWTCRVMTVGGGCCDKD